MKNEIFNAKSAREIADKVYSETIGKEKIKFVEFILNCIKTIAESGQYEIKFDIASKDTEDILEDFPKRKVYIEEVIHTLTGDKYLFKVVLTRKDNKVDGIIETFTVSF